jgi:hypothetical protein
MRGVFLGCVAVAAALPGCATQELRSYVGQPVGAAIGRYGAPATSDPLPGGRRSFVWVFGGDGRVANQPALSAFAPVSRYPIQERRARIGAGPFPSGVCEIALVGRWDEGTRQWIIADVRPRTIDCT